MKNVQERKNIAFFWKERMPNPATNRNNKEDQKLSQNPPWLSKVL